MRFVVAQIGARRGYAVPAILENAGLLERFYTDMTSDARFGTLLMKYGSLLGRGNAVTTFGGRRVPESIRAKTTTFPWLTLWFGCRRTLSGSDPADRFREHLRLNTALGCAAARQGFGYATHLYSIMVWCVPSIHI